jgi:antitoxin (DNA-binding transcriptional repressor) of toxin-antitoxin stability system
MIGCRIHRLGDWEQKMLTKTVNIQDAETNLMELIKLALQGDEIIITEADKPLVRLTPVAEPLPPRVAGLNKGEIWVSDDFDEPLPDEFWANQS